MKVPFIHVLTFLVFKSHRGFYVILSSKSVSQPDFFHPRFLFFFFLNKLCFPFSSVSPSQSFPSDEGWPFAKYLGACGRVVAVNYVGEELWNFYNAAWEKRVDLARQLMDIAEQLTNNDFDFALYLLDVSFDNFAVGPRDGKVIVVDAENVLVADKRLIKQSE